MVYVTLFISFKVCSHFSSSVEILIILLSNFVLFNKIDVFNFIAWSGIFSEPMLKNKRNYILRVLFSINSDICSCFVIIISSFWLNNQIIFKNTFSAYITIINKQITMTLRKKYYTLLLLCSKISDTVFDNSYSGLELEIKVIFSWKVEFSFVHKSSTGSNIFSKSLTLLFTLQN